MGHFPSDIKNLAVCSLKHGFIANAITMPTLAIKTLLANIVQFTLIYLINIQWLSVDFDWSTAGHAEGAIQSFLP